MKRRNLYRSLFFLLPVIYFLSLPISVGDLAIWVAQGKYFIETGHLLRHDIFSILPTRDLIYPAGTCILYALIYVIGGLIGVSLLHKTAILVLSSIWWRSSLTHLKSPAALQTLFLVLFCWFGASPICIDRPALLATVPFLFSFIVLQKENELSWKDIIGLTVINIVWVNLHGSWVLLGAMYVWRESGRSLLFRPAGRLPRISRRQIFGLVALTMSSLLNPFGYRVFTYVTETSRISKIRGIDEWATTGLSGHYLTQAIAFYLLCGCAGLCFALWMRRDREKAILFLTSPFMILLLAGLHSVRNTVWAFVALIPAAHQFGLIIEDPSREENAGVQTGFRNSLIVGALVLSMILFLPYFKPRFSAFLPAEKRPVFDSSAPFAFARILGETADHAPIFNDWEYGSFLALSQPHPIFIDTRNIIYDHSDFMEYMRVIDGADGWSRILDRYGIGYVILNRQLRSRLLSLLASSGAWQKIMEDENTVLLQRRSMGPAQK